MGTWVISTEYTTGIAVLGLPIEEMLFFAAAGLMTINGLVLFEWVLDWNDRRAAAHSLVERLDPADDTPEATERNAGSDTDRDIDPDPVDD